MFSAFFVLSFSTTNWLRWQILPRTHALAYPLRPLTSRSARRTCQNRFEIASNTPLKTKTHTESSANHLSSFDHLRKIRTSRVALEGEGFQFVNIEQLEQRGRCLCLFSSLCNTFLACVCICKPKKIRRSNVFVSCHTSSAWRIQIEWQGS